MSQRPQLEPFSPDARPNPYPLYAQMRASSPVHCIALPEGRGVWLITRYVDAERMLRDRRLVKDPRNALTPEQISHFPGGASPLAQHMLTADPPDHTRLRALVSKAFTPRLIEGLRDRIQQIADELLDAVGDQPAMDLIDDYAFPLPIIVITELLGVPSQDRDQFRQWSNVLMETGLVQEGEPMPDETLSAMEQFTAYLHRLLEEKRRDPQDDLVTGLVLAEEAGDALSEDELLAMVFLLLVAGHETTVNLIGNGMLALLRHPDQLHKLCDNSELIKPAIEELLRYDGPVETATRRYASTDVEIGGTMISKGDTVLVALGSANRDTDEFTDADQLDITRTDNRHLAFGKGIHFCLGAQLARLEGQIAINTLLRRLPTLQLAVPLGELEWRPGLIIRGLRRLPVLCGPAGRRRVTRATPGR